MNELMKGKRIMTTKQYIIPQTEISIIRHTTAICAISFNTQSSSGETIGDPWSEAL